MTDLALDSNFDVFLDDRKNIATVDGRDEFEQSVVVQLTEYMYNIPGSTDIATQNEKIRLQVGRVARNNDILDSIEKIVIERVPNEPGSIRVELVYSSSAAFDFNLNL